MASKVRQRCQALSEAREVQVSQWSLSNGLCITLFANVAMMADQADTSPISISTVHNLHNALVLASVCSARIRTQRIRSEQRQSGG